MSCPREALIPLSNWTERGAPPQEHQCVQMISWTSWAVGVALHFTAIQKYEHISTILRKEPNSIFEFTTQMSILRKDLLCETLKVRPKGIGASLSFKLCKQKSHVIASNILLKFRIKKKGFKCCSRRCRLRCSTLLMM